MKLRRRSLPPCPECGDELRHERTEWNGNALITCTNVGCWYVERARYLNGVYILYRRCGQERA